MADIKISELTQAESLSLSDLMESAIPYNGGFQSRRMSLAQLSNYLENSVLHNALDTTAKNIIGAINEIVLDLANYYTKSETYSKTKIDELIAGVSGLHFLVVQTLPVSDIDPNTIYLVPKQDVGTQDIYDEFIYIVEEAPTPSHWEKIGTTEIDLSDYVTDTELATELLNYVTTSALNTTLQSYATTSAMTTALADKVDKVQGKGLSTEDYTTVEKAKLNGIEPSAQVNVQADWTETDASLDSYIWNKPNVNNVSIAQGTDFGGILKPIAFTEFYSPSNENTYNHGIFRATDIWKYSNVKGTTSVIGQAHLYAGNWLTNGQEYNAKGYLGVYDESDHTAELTVNGTLTASRTYYLPDKDGTLALVSDLPNNPVLWSEQNLLGAKNLIPYPYEDTTKSVGTLNFADNGDGTITINGTANSNARFYIDETISNPINYPLKGGLIYKFTRGYTTQTDAYIFIRCYYTANLSNNESVLVELKNEDKNIDLTNYPTIYGIRIGIVVANGTVVNNITFKPMIRLASITDETWEPYAMTNRDLTVNKVEWESQNILGSKNLLPYPYINNIGVTSAGVTYTVDEKGWIHCSGTSTGNSIFTCSDKTVNGGMFLPNGNYRVSGCPEGGSSSGGNGAYQLIIDATISGATYTYCYETGDGATFTVNGDDFSNDGAWVRVRCVCRKTVVSDSLVFKPMVMLASIKDNTYEPQANTNRQLTLNKIDKELIAPTENGFNASKAYAVGDYMFWRRGFYRVTTAISQGGAIANGTNVTQTTLGAELKRALT